MFLDNSGGYCYCGRGRLCRAATGRPPPSSGTNANLSGYYLTVREIVPRWRAGDRHAARAMERWAAFFRQGHRHDH